MAAFSQTARVRVQEIVTRCTLTLRTVHVRDITAETQTQSNASPSLSCEPARCPPRKVTAGFLTGPSRGLREADAAVSGSQGRTRGRPAEGSPGKPPIRLPNAYQVVPTPATKSPGSRRDASEFLTNRQSDLKSSESLAHRPSGARVFPRSWLEKGGTRSDKRGASALERTLAWISAPTLTNQGTWGSYLPTLCLSFFIGNTGL